MNRCLAEGRKSFLERYAGIESGQECERLAPALSAFVDGEADAAQTVALRAHLRQCLACRATVRGPARRLPAADGCLPCERARHGRTAASSTPVASSCACTRPSALHLHERAANSFLRAQAVFDTVTAGKMAAVAASAAAVAGGGFAVEGVVTPAAPDRPAAILRGAVGGGGVPVLKTVSPSHARATSRSHAGSRPRTKQRRSRSQPSGSAAASRQGRKPAVPTASRTATTTISSQPRPVAQPRAVAASAGASHSGSSAAGEFGFEGP